MKVLVTGSHGLVGSAIVPLLRGRFEVLAFDIEEWDITDKDMGARVLKEHEPHVVVNLAAMTNVDGCEDHPQEAQKLNSDGPATIAGLCKERGVRLVHFSTDYVFDGEKGSPYTEEDKTNPMSAYGRTKLSGETRIFEILPSSLVIRAQWLYGRSEASFISKVVKIARETGAARVVNDQSGAPTYAQDLAEPLARLIEKGKSGVYHAANGGSCTWYEFAKEIFSCLSMDIPVTPITSSNLNRKAKRPTYSVFDLTKISADTCMTMRSWQEALRDFLAHQ